MSIFVDTSAFLAVLNADDQFHPAAKEIWLRLLTAGEAMVCNNYILVETYALLQHRFGMQAIRSFQSDVLPILLVRWVDEETHNRAVSAVLAAGERRLSLVDCCAFETMRALGIQRVFTFDQDFGDYGFEVLPDI
jgi:predicted nucleic acid-binding protein